MTEIDYNAPYKLVVEQHGNHFHVFTVGVCGHRVVSMYLQRAASEIPGARYHDDEKLWTVPFASEDEMGQRLFNREDAPWTITSHSAFCTHGGVSKWADTGKRLGAFGCLAGEGTPGDGDAA